MTADHCMHNRYCVRLFDKFGLARAPVLEGGKIVGIVSYTDRVMKWLGGACC
jgi:predicted transcriptional regulator